MNNQLKQVSYKLKFTRSDSEVHSLIEMAGPTNDNLPEDDFNFPGNCCILTIKLYRSNNVRTFTCLVWLMEKKFKNQRVYFCSVKIDLQTKINLFFTPKRADQTTADNEMTLRMSKIEISSKSQISSKIHNEKYEFYSSLKKSQLDETEDNYKFNIGLDDVDDFVTPNDALVEHSVHPTIYEQTQTLPKLAQAIALSQLDTANVLESLSDQVFCNKADYLNSIEQLLGSEKHFQLSDPKILLANVVDRDMCLSLQTMVKEVDDGDYSNIIQNILEGLLPQVFYISTSIYGNFLVQYLIPKLNDDQLKSLCQAYVPVFGNLCQDHRGIFCVQKLAECIRTNNEQQTLTNSLIANMSVLIKNEQAGFVFKKAIQIFAESKVLRLLEEVGRHFLDYSCDKYGICVIKFMIQRFENNRPIFETIAKYFFETVKQGRQNSHFNFGVQHLIEVTNRKRWNVSMVENIMIAYLQGDCSSRVRSRAIAETLQLMLTYHSKSFVKDNILPKISNLFEQQHNTGLRSNLQNILKCLKMHWKDSKELDNILNQ